VSNHWLKGGEGAIELAEAVVAACEEENHFDYLYELNLPLKERVSRIASELYGAAGVDWSPEAEKKITQFQADPEAAGMGTCMVKTHLSLSHDPDFKGAPKGWRLPIRDVLIYKGAGFVVPVAGDIKLMPGTGSNPGFRRIDVDVETGKVIGLF
jgi:formate--tetrahydrofolate ligase